MSVTHLKTLSSLWFAHRIFLSYGQFQYIYLLSVHNWNTLTSTRSTNGKEDAWIPNRTHPVHFTVSRNVYPLGALLYFTYSYVLKVCLLTDSNPNIDQFRVFKLRQATAALNRKIWQSCLGNSSFNLSLDLTYSFPRNNPTKMFIYLSYACCMIFLSTNHLISMKWNVQIMKLLNR